MTLIHSFERSQKWPWVNTNYHQNWVREHPNKDYYINFLDVHQGYRVLTHTHMEVSMGNTQYITRPWRSPYGESPPASSSAGISSGGSGPNQSGAAARHEDANEPWKIAADGQILGCLW